MRGVKLIEVDKQKAKQEWKDYCVALRGKKNSFYRDYLDLKNAYRFLKDGKKIIDVFDGGKEKNFGSTELG